MRRAPSPPTYPSGSEPLAPEALLPEAQEDSFASDFDERPSKSALKRQSHELQALGLELSELSAKRVEALNLPESLQDALAQFHRTRSHEGRRRQVQLIGKLMRQVDPEPIRQAVAAAKLGSAAETLSLHEAERWREELLNDDEAVTRWINEFPATEAQPLRSLVRAARKDLKNESPAQRHGRPYRELFQLIKAGLAGQAAGGAGAGAAPEDEADHD